MMMILGGRLKPIEHFSILNHRQFSINRTMIQIREPSRQDPSAELIAVRANNQGKE